MSSLQWTSKVVPAQLSFLAIYNPALGPTDETFRDQVVYYYSRVANENRKKARNDAAVTAELREEENEKLRQIGLAQGMVDFARSFSDGEAVDSVETEKSRLVLHEVEKGWWILASIDLTRLPIHQPPTSTAPTNTSKGGGEKPNFEPSSREVSPAPLLLQQLLQAHNIFCLHHGPSLSDLYVRLPREKFCNILERFWTRFSRGWDVLLHGNPAVDVFNGLKLTAGGELGFGVGEEDWGSGEREVLEDLAHRTEGLVDLVVSRFGEPANVPEKFANNRGGPEADTGAALPWLGSGTKPIHSDGVLFGGIGAISRPSVRNISLWMQQIYTYGDFAYGVRDNPHRERRKRRRRNPPEAVKQSANGHSRAGSKSSGPKDMRRMVQTKEAGKQAEPQTPLIDPDLLPKDKRPQIHDRVASHDHATANVQPQVASHPGVPPPIVSAAEEALDMAIDNASKDTNPDGMVKEEGSGTTFGVPDQYMKYLTFGLSTVSWTSAPSPQKRPKGPRRTSTETSSKTLRPALSEARKDSSKTLRQDDIAEDDEEMQMHLTSIDPMPDGESLEHKIAMQKRQENKGHFLIGLKGDLEEVLTENDGVGGDVTDGSFYDDGDGSRTLLRTVQVEILPKASSEEDDPRDAMSRQKSLSSFASSNEATKRFQRLRVLVYIHRPFIYGFLFEQRTPALSVSSFYKSLHQNLVPIHKPLLSSTNIATVAQRIADSHAVLPGNEPANTEKTPYEPPKNIPILDLVYDPASLTVHTSIPNIPEPGTPAAEGIGPTSSGKDAPPPWTRVEAINVHSQILNTLTSTQRSRGEIERTSKTSRGWWVVWMRIRPSDTADDSAPSITVTSASASGTSTPFDPDNRKPNHPLLAPDMSRIAFLVRKASDAAAASKSSGGSRAASGMGMGMFGLSSLRGVSAEDTTGGAAAGWGPGALAGGIGIDARRYVEGLLSLNR